MAVTWESIEPEEGRFDFSLLDEILVQARRENLRLGLLWFGLWKNSISSYIPGWAKADTGRFSRVRDRNGQPLDIVSPLARDAVKADAKAFAALMEHLKQVDSDDHTVILIQVENEIGILGSDRDYSDSANEFYTRSVPKVMSDIYGHNGNWEEAFGEDAPEYFMEYYYAAAVETIAGAGKAAYPLPMITNAWLQQFPWRPGTYPSGGPVAQFRALWKQAAPSVSVNAPDVYISDFKSVCDAYASDDNPLMIPEHRRDIKNISHVFYAIGKYNALCFSPFGVEDMMTPPDKLMGLSNPQTMKMLNIDPAAWTCDKTGNFIRETYGVLSQALPMLRKGLRENRTRAFMRFNEHEKDCDLKIDYLDRASDTPKAAGIIVESDDEREFYVIGVNFRYSLMPAKNKADHIGIEEYSEGKFERGVYIRSRMLNGDERFSMLQTELPVAQKVKWFFY